MFAAVADGAVMQWGSAKRIMEDTSGIDRISNALAALLCYQSRELASLAPSHNAPSFA